MLYARMRVANKNRKKIIRNSIHIMMSPVFVVHTKYFLLLTILIHLLSPSMSFISVGTAHGFISIRLLNVTSYVNVKKRNRKCRKTLQQISNIQRYQIQLNKKYEMSNNWDQQVHFFFVWCFTIWSRL